MFEPHSAAPAPAPAAGERAAWPANPATARALAAVLLAVAIALGAGLRFGALGAREMSADEGASWAAAAAPTLGAVVRMQALLNPGKLALHEVALHLWMRLFGDGVAAMRALSAALGTLGVAVVFLLARELLGGPRSPRPPGGETAHGGGRARGWALGGMPAGEADAVAALAALLFAVNLVTIKYSRELRMYALALLLVLVQVWFFMRALGRGGRFNPAALAALTALAVGAHFSAAFMVAAEGLCLPAFAPGGWRGVLRPRRSRRQLSVAVALGAGIALFALMAAPALRTGASAFAHGATSWIERPPWWAPLSLFNKATGSFAFPVMAALAGWGVWRGWRRAPGAVAFALGWMWLPPLLMLLASYGFAPMFVERFALWCFVPFFILAALGAWELGGRWAPASAIGLAMALALGHLWTYRQRPHDVQWREAARAALSGLAPGAIIAVAPPYAVNVVRYYLRGSGSSGAATPAGEAEGEMLIAADRWIARGKAAKLLAKYPRPVARFRGVRVQRRRQRAD